jgi:tetratricopeptide (TPR) repeat protein
MAADRATDGIELGTLLEKHRLLPEAVAVYRAAVAVATPPERAVARWLLARVLVQQGLRREAAAELQLALAQDSANPELHLQRAHVLAALGDAGARDAYQLAAVNADVLARRSGEERDVFGPLPPRLRGIVAAAIGPRGSNLTQYREAYAQYLTDNQLWAQALREWQVIVGDWPKSAAAHFGRGVALDGLGARERAVEAYREAVTLDGNNVGLRLRFAQALWQTDQYFQAINEWRTVLARAPGHVEARLALARAYVRTGSRGEAAREYEYLLLIAPDRAEVRQEFARLRSSPQQ